MEKKYWFKAKQYGWGWYPATWQGWAILAMYIFAALTTSLYIDAHEHSVSDSLMGFFPIIYILTVFLIIICYKTGEKPGWRWGQKKDEMLDTYTVLGEKTGDSVSRKEVHQKGLWHKNAHIFIVNNKGEVLLQKRSATKESNPNLWGGSAGGHIESGQGSIEAAIRETEEELGVKFTALDFEYIGTARDQVVLNNGTYINNQFNDVYVIKTDLAVEKFKKQDAEVAELRFVPISEFEESVKNHDPAFVRCASFPLFFSYASKK